jgi:alpha-N-arabinofuranosidase
MTTTTLIVDRDFTIAPVPRRLFGSFVEHLGRCVYGGVYEPGHPSADARGFRRDVIDLAREAGVSVIRYPGGNFVSGYRWEDGVGPREHRPRRRDLAWTSTETNHFGTNEFIDFCHAVGAEPMLAVNLGTRGPAAAADYHEYCNHPGGTALSELRRAHGYPTPHGVRLWCLGNEADGPWQMGQKPPGEYGRQAREAAKLMASAPDVNRSGTPMPVNEFVACGSSSRGMTTFGQWDQAVLEECFDKVDYLSVHSYVSPRKQGPESYLAFVDTTMAPLIREVIAICDAVAARRRSARRIHLSYDEWNVWYFDPEPPFEAWAVAPPLLEDRYTMLDALQVGAMLITLINHCDRVRIACQAQLVNVIGMIMTRTGGPAWRQTVFHPFAQASAHARGRALRIVPAEDPGYWVDGVAVSNVLAAVVHDSQGLCVFALNRDLTAPAALRVELRGFGPLTVMNASVLRDEDLGAINTEATPNRVRPLPLGGASVIGQTVRCELPKASWCLIRLREERKL